jgi:integrase
MLFARAKLARSAARDESPAVVLAEQVRWPVDIPRVRRQHRAPDLLSGTEVERSLQASVDLERRTIFKLLYGTGLRVSELLASTVTDIELPAARAQGPGHGPLELTVTVPVVSAASSCPSRVASHCESSRLPLRLAFPVKECRAALAGSNAEMSTRL